MNKFFSTNGWEILDISQIEHMRCYKDGAFDYEFIVEVHMRSGTRHAWSFGTNEKRSEDFYKKIFSELLKLTQYNLPKPNDQPNP